MSSKLAPLALLIPAVVLAQPAPPTPAPQPPQNQLIPKNIEQNALPNPAGINKAAAAQALSKARSSNSLGATKSGYYTYTTGGDRIWCTNGGLQCTFTHYKTN
jgi:hypothetical protein